MQVRMVQEAEERLKKELRTMSRSASAAKLQVSQDKAAVRQQMEADRLERASRKS